MFKNYPATHRLGTIQRENFKSRFPHGCRALQAIFSAYEQGKTELRMNEVDEDFLDFFNIELIAGRNFSEDAATRYSPESFVSRKNRDQLTAVKTLKWNNPIGKLFGVKGRRPGYIVSVFKDFHTLTLHEPIRHE